VTLGAQNKPVDLTGDWVAVITFLNNDEPGTQHHENVVDILQVMPD
jgi:hypothetical protein